MILRNKMEKVVLSITILAIIIFFSLPVFAHRIVLYAYVEGDKIIAEGGFGDGSPAKNAEITVHNKAGKLLAEGKTDKNGVCEIQIPAKTDLELKMRAGMGHQAEYSISESELPDLAQQQSKSSSALETNSQTVNEEQLRKIIAEELDKKLNPIKKSIIQANQDTGPGFTEIIGGIGYIFGLMGVALYFKKGKK
jgi:nickel transport protein